MLLEACRIDPTYFNSAGAAKLLPARMKPQPDELLSSWLIRLAMAHGLKLHSFCAAVFGRNFPIWNRDIDKSANRQFLSLIAERTGLSFDEVFATTLAAYAGKIYEKHNARGSNVWIMPLQIYHRLHRRNGLQFCPSCLREDREAYYRREWRLSWITICEKHKIVLLDHCPDCLKPVVFHRQDLGNKNQPVAYSLTECSFCGSLWTAGRVVSSCRPANDHSIRFQKILKETVNSEWGKIRGFGTVHAIVFFKGLKQILRVLSVCNRSATFRKEIVRRSKINIQITANEMSFDYLSVERRYQVLQAAKWLLDRWSEAFVEIAQTTKTWSSVLLPQDENVPFWYLSVVKENLIKNYYGASEEEIISALSLIEKKSQKRKSIILPAHLKKFMQNKNILRKKSAKFITAIYERMNQYNLKFE